MLSGAFFASLAGEQLGGPHSDFVVVEWTDAGTSEWEWIAPLHVHHADDEAWYVLDGRLGFQVGDGTREVGPGESILVQRGTPHSLLLGLACISAPCTPALALTVQSMHGGA